MPHIILSFTKYWKIYISSINIVRIYFSKLINLNCHINNEPITYINDLYLKIDGILQYKEYFSIFSNK